MAFAAAGFTVETLFILSFVGFGLSAFALPGKAGRPLLIAPVTGLAVISLGNQWLTWFVPVSVVVVVLLPTFGALSIVMAVRLMAAATAPRRFDWRLPAVLGFLGLAGCLGTLAFVYGPGAFTLAGPPSDPIHLYAPAGQWLLNHPFMPGAPVPVTNPILNYLEFASRTMPGSVGTLDAFISVLTGWPIHALFDPLDAALLALSALATFVLVSVGLGHSRLTASIAFCLVFASSLLQWVVTSGYQQELESLPLLFGGLALMALAMRDGGLGGWLLTAVLLAPLVGIYFPVAALAAVLIVPGAAVLGLRRLLRRRWPVEARVLAAGVLGLALAAPSIYWIIVRGGLGTWVSLANLRIGPGGVQHFYPLGYVLGTSPLTRLTAGWPTFFWTDRWDMPGLIAAIALLLLIALGALAVARDRFAAVWVIVSVLAYLLYLRVVSPAPYNFIKTVSYLAPASMALAAVGVTTTHSLLTRVVGSGRLAWPRAWPSPATALLSAALTGVVVMQAASSVEEQLATLTIGPGMPTSAFGLASLRAIVPHGASVLVYDPHDYTKSSLRIIWNYEAALYFLTGHANTPMVVEGPATGDPYYVEWSSGAGDATFHEGEHYDFLLTSLDVASRVPTSLHPVWMQADLGLVLFQRGEGGSSLDIGGSAAVPPG